MQVLIKSTSSRVEDLILIETATTIGDQTTVSRTGYPVDELMENRFLSGDLETRIEALRVGAEAVTTRSVELHFKTLMKVLRKEPEITDVSAVPSSQLAALSEEGKQAAEVVIEKLDKEIKKTRAKRATKTTTTESN